MEVRSVWNKMGNNASGAIATYKSWKVCSESVSKFQSGLTWINSRSGRSNLTYFHSGSSPAPGESDNLTYVIFF